MHKKHLLMMLICCLVPIIGLAAAALFNIPLGKMGFYGMMILCPVLHLLMMRSMMGGHHHHEGEENPGYIQGSNAHHQDTNPKRGFFP